MRNVSPLLTYLFLVVTVAAASSSSAFVSNNVGIPCRDGSMITSIGSTKRMSVLNDNSSDWKREKRPIRHKHLPSSSSRRQKLIDNSLKRAAPLRRPSDGSLSGRRPFLTSLSSSVLGMATIASCNAKHSSVVANAACLSGDTSVDCIGFYKVPIDDAILPYVGSPESLEKYAPGLRWVPPVPIPKTYRDAVTELETLRTHVQNLHDTVLKGQLEDAGVSLLGILPRVTVAGRVVVRTLNDSPSKSSGGGDLSMRALRAEEALQNVQATLGQCDIMIGQALRGEMGALTAAQIGILPSVDEACVEFGDLMRAIPENFDPRTSLVKDKKK